MTANAEQPRPSSLGSPVRSHRPRQSRIPRAITIATLVCGLALGLLWFTSSRLSPVERQLVGQWMMSREYTAKDGTTGHSDFYLILNANRSFTWSWKDRATGAGGSKPWTGQWSVSTQQGKPLLNMRGHQSLWKRVFSPSNDSAAYLNQLSANEFVWQQADGPETFQRQKLNTEN